MKSGKKVENPWKARKKGEDHQKCLLYFALDFG
jgi:hypothetical protein